MAVMRSVVVSVRSLTGADAQLLWYRALNTYGDRAQVNSVL